MIDIKQLKVQFVTDQSGARSAVILPIDQFEELLEDLEDLAVIAARMDEPTISHEEFLAELKKNGLLPD